MRRRLNYANVAATLALVFSMSGGALAAQHYLISSTTQISPKVLKKLKGHTGAKGAAGTAGTAGTPGAKGDTGIKGEKGLDGANGTAIAYAHVNSNATLDAANSAGVVDVKRFPGFSAGFYCLYGSFSAHVATAAIDYSESSGGQIVQEIGLTASQIASCPASATGTPAKAIVLVRPISAPSELVDAGFYITFN